MNTIALRGHRLHAPENSRAALISGYVAGADALEFSVRITQDNELVLAADATTERVTGQAGTIASLTRAQLAAMDWSETFAPRQGGGFKYYPPATRMLAPLFFAETLEWLPEAVQLLVGLPRDAALPAARRDELVTRTVGALQDRRATARALLWSDDPAVLARARQLAPGLRLVFAGAGLPPAAQLTGLRDTAADGLLTDLESVWAAGQLTAHGQQLQAICTAQPLKVGAVLVPRREPGVFTREEFAGLGALPFVWGLGTDSVLDVQSFVRRPVTLVRHDFAGEKVDLERFAFGYAKANKYAVVYQRDGVHIDIDAYDQPFPNPANPLDRRLTRIETGLDSALRDWPFYSGGGVGYTPGIRGDFSAQVDYRVETMAQATTLEMAVLNVDPGAHVAARPASARQKDSFFDPHGAPPYVGVEHDENDGYRINWNLGTEYDNNQYGRPVGDGSTPRGATIRLERRGPFFSAYYRNAVDGAGQALGPGDWVCVGSTRNDSLNPVVYLRCVGKRWRQESETDPSQYMPIIPNKFTFTNLVITRHQPFFP